MGNDLQNIDNNLNSFNNLSDLFNNNKMIENPTKISKSIVNEENPQQNDVQNFLLNMNQFDEI